MNSALFDLEWLVCDAKDAVSMAAAIAEMATDDHHVGLLMYATFEAERKLKDLHAEFYRQLEDRPKAANDSDVKAAESA